MRKFIWIPVMLVVLACGGSGVNFTYPNTKTLAIEIRNDSNAPIELGMLGDRETMAAGATRTESHTRTWIGENQVHTFVAEVNNGAGIGTARIDITGKESHGQNFNGFLVTWDGTTIRMVTR